MLPSKSLTRLHTTAQPARQGKGRWIDEKIAHVERQTLRPALAPRSVL
jgi:hypothetical protein